MKFLSLTLFILMSIPAFAGDCKVVNTITKKKAMMNFHDSSKEVVFQTDLSGCLEIVQHNYMILERNLQKDTSVTSLGLYFDTDELGIKDEERFYLSATSFIEPQTKECVAFIDRERGYLGRELAPQVVVKETIENRTSLSDIEECIAKTGLSYLRTIKDDSRFEPLVMRMSLKSDSGRSFQFKMSGHKNIPNFKRTILPLILKLNP